MRAVIGRTEHAGWLDRQITDALAASCGSAPAPEQHR
jgi:hypothetical protein